METDLRAQMIARSEIMEIQNNFDAQLKDHANVASKLQVRLIIGYLFLECMYILVEFSQHLSTSSCYTSSVSMLVLIYSVLNPTFHERLTAVDMSLQEQLHEKEQAIHDLERKLEEKDRELHATKLDNEAVKSNAYEISLGWFH